MIGSVASLPPTGAPSNAIAGPASNAAPKPNTTPTIRSMIRITTFLGSTGPNHGARKRRLELAAKHPGRRPLMGRTARRFGRARITGGVQKFQVVGRGRNPDGPEVVTLSGDQHVGRT